MFSNGGGLAPPPKPIGIFWDIENCSIPRGIFAGPLIRHIRNTFVQNRLNHREFEFQIACDVTTLKREIQEDIRRAGCVTLAHVSNSAKNSADEQLREAMKKFVDTHSLLNPVLLLISGDIDFVNDLRGYQTRIGCYVILLYGPSCSSQFRDGWNEVYDFRTFCSGVTNPRLVSLTTVERKDINSRDRRDVGATRTHASQSDTVRAPGRGRGRVSGSLNNRIAGQGKESNDNQRGGFTSSSNNQRGKAQTRNNVPDRGSVPLNSQSNSARKSDSKASNKAKFGMSQSTNNLLILSNGNGKSSPSASGSERGSCSSDLNGVVGGNVSRSKFILMVSGLPGKMDYKILRDQLQSHAAEVKGFVVYVKNGQGFITFQRKADADAAVELFNGREIYGKKLRITFVERIPFEERVGLPKPKTNVTFTKIKERTQTKESQYPVPRTLVFRPSSASTVSTMIIGTPPVVTASSRTPRISTLDNLSHEKVFQERGPSQCNGIIVQPEQAKEALNYQNPHQTPWLFSKMPSSANGCGSGSAFCESREIQKDVKVLGVMRKIMQDDVNVSGPNKVKPSKPKNDCCIS